MEYMTNEICLERKKVMDERLGRDRERIDRLERLCEAINTQNTNIERLVVELKHIQKLLSSQEERILAIEEQPKNRLSQIITAIISAIAGGCITGFIAFVMQSV